MVLLSRWLGAIRRVPHVDGGDAQRRHSGSSDADGSTQAAASSQTSLLASSSHYGTPASSPHSPEPTPAPAAHFSFDPASGPDADDLEDSFYETKSGEEADNALLPSISELPSLELESGSAESSMIGGAHCVPSPSDALVTSSQTEESLDFSRDDALPKESLSLSEMDVEDCVIETVSALIAAIQEAADASPVREDVASEQEAAVLAPEAMPDVEKTGSSRSSPLSVPDLQLEAVEPVGCADCSTSAEVEAEERAGSAAEEQSSASETRSTSSEAESEEESETEASSEEA